MLEGFEEYKIKHVLRANNIRVDILFKLVSTKGQGKHRLEL